MLWCLFTNFPLSVVDGYSKAMTFLPPLDSPVHAVSILWHVDKVICKELQMLEEVLNRYGNGGCHGFIFCYPTNHDTDSKTCVA